MSISGTERGMGVKKKGGKVKSEEEAGLSSSLIYVQAITFAITVAMLITYQAEHLCGC